MGFGFRIFPGVRIGASTRGVGIGVDAGPFSYYSRTGSGSRRRSSGPSRTSIAAYERQVRAAQRQQEVQTVLDLDRELVQIGSVHEEDFAPTEPPPPAVAAPVDEKAIHKRLIEEHLVDVPLFRLSERRQAKAQAKARLPAEVESAGQAAEESRVQAQAGLDRAWRDLVDNDPQTVLATLEDAFEDNQAPAAAIGCRGDRVDVLMRWPELDAIVGERKFAHTPTGKPTHHKRSATDRNTLYLRLMASNALATAKEALAEAPGINRIALLIVRGADDPAVGDRMLEPLFAGVIERTQLEGVHWANMDPAATLADVPECKLEIKGRTDAVTPIDLSDDPDSIATLGQVAVSVGCRSPYPFPEQPAVEAAIPRETGGW
jgi:hypothetical protein